MFKRLRKNRLWLIAIVILLIFIGAIAMNSSKEKETKESQETGDKIEYGEDVTVENDTPGLDVSDDDGTEQNSVSVPGTWEENSGNTSSDSTVAGDSNTGKTDSATQNTEDHNSEQGTEQNILEDDKSWGNIF
jgi:hypothetical protein